MRTVFFILGMHRSGTSALGGVLDILEIKAGSELLPANDTNPKGYFENEKIYWHNENILKHCGSCWSDSIFDINRIDKGQFKEFVAQGIEVLQEEFNDYNKFMIKDPRICMLFPIWEEACKQLGLNIKIILPHRNPMEVAESLKSRNHFSVEQGLILWLQHFFLAEKYSRNYPRIFLPYSLLINDAETYSKQLCEFTNSKIEKGIKNKIDGFIDKGLKHINLSFENNSENMPSFLLEVISLLKNDNLTNETKMDELRTEFFLSQKLFQHSGVNEEREKNQIYKKRLDEMDLLLSNQESHVMQLNSKIKESTVTTGRLISKIEIEKENHINTLKLLDKKSEETSLLIEQQKIKEAILRGQLKSLKQETQDCILENKTQWENWIKTYDTNNQLAINNLNLFSSIHNRHLGRLKTQSHINKLQLINPFRILNNLKNLKSITLGLNQIKQKFNRVSLRAIEFFNEEQYLKQNQDIKESISKGGFKDALEHFILFGYDEVYKGQRKLYSQHEVKFEPSGIDKESDWLGFDQFLINQNKKLLLPEIEVADVIIDFSSIEELI